MAEWRRVMDAQEQTIDQLKVKVTNLESEKQEEVLKIRKLVRQTWVGVLAPKSTQLCENNIELKTPNHFSTMEK